MGPPAALAICVIGLTVGCSSASPTPSASPTQLPTPPVQTSSAAPPPSRSAPPPTPLPSPTETAAPPTAKPTPTPAAVTFSDPDLVLSHITFGIDVAVDSQGYVHVVGNDGPVIFYATNKSGSWQDAELANAPQGGAVFWPTIAASPDGTIAVAYSSWRRWFFCEGDVCEPDFENEFDDVYYVTGDGSAWSEPSPVPGSGEEPDLSFSGEDLYATRTSEEMASWSVLHDGVWSTPTDFEVGLSALVIDREGRPNFLLLPGVEAVLRTPSDGGAFVDDKVPGVGRSSQPLLVFDSANRPQIVYTDYDASIDDERVFTITRDGGTWTTPALLPVRGADAAALDSGDKLNLVFAKGDSACRWFDLRYALIDDASVSRVRLDRSNCYELGTNGEITMALDAQDQPHVVYTSEGIDGEDGTYYVVGTLRP